jgi:hypothetical protein
MSTPFELNHSTRRIGAPHHRQLIATQQTRRSAAHRHREAIGGTAARFWL